VNSKSAPPTGNGRDPARQDALAQSEPSTARHRVAADLPPQLSPAGSAPRQAAEPSRAGAPKGILGLAAEISRLATMQAKGPAAGIAKDAVTRDAAAPVGKPGDLTLPAPSTSAKVAAAAPSSATAPSGMSASAAPGRVVLGAGEPEPPISARPDGVAGSYMEPRRIAPRSPRAALEPDHVPAPSRPSRRARNPLVIVGNAVFTALVLVLILAGAAVVFGKSQFEAPGPLQEDKVVTIPPRLGMLEIADLLKHEGVVDAHRLIFIGGVFALKARSDLKAGEYLFTKGASMKDVVETIVEGKVVQHQLTIPEGLTSEQIVARLLDNDILAGNIKDVPREGSLLPDSYHFNRGFTREQMIQRMRQAQERLVRDVWERRNPDLPLKSPEQLVILASIIEKETGKPEERTRIAAVLTNRLKQKMKLQSDPTIIYGLVFGKGALGHPLTKSEIAQPTPYNTYVIDGLPPGPIANPGRASIEAAASPARTKELYFVADGTGGHAFAESYEQHMKNVARLRAIEHEQKGEAPAADAQPPASPPRASPVLTPLQRAKRSANGAAKGTAAPAQ
jgi:UPF0755 protein